VHPDGDLAVAASIAVLTMPILASASFGGYGARIMVEIAIPIIFTCIIYRK
jgi:hypothetical protein